MSNSWTYRFKLWVFSIIERALPDGVRRQVLYALEYRAFERRGSIESRLTPEWPWDISYKELYEGLRD